MAPRSRTGCLTCRQRKMKCTEQKPICAQCAKANRECVLSSGITFRHQQNPSMNATVQGEASLKSFYGYRETFAKSTKWVDVPRDLKFIYTNNPYEDEEGEEDAGHYVSRDTTAGDEDFAARLAALADNATRYEEDVRGRAWETSQTPSYPAYPTHGLEALSAAVASQDAYNYALRQAPMSHGEQAHGGQASLQQPQPTTSPSIGHPTTGPPHDNLDFILNHHSAELTPGGGNIDPRLHTETPDTGQSPPPLQYQQSPFHVRTSSYISAFGRPRLHSKGSLHRRVPSIENPELGFLMRDLSERAGLWMDLFDLGLFFATKVPVLAVKCPLLLYSCVALSAKSLARVDGRKPMMGGQVTPTRQSTLETWPGSALDAEGWVRRAREYYDLAVTLLRQALAGASRPQPSSLSEDASSHTVAASRGAPLPTTDSDELVASTAILCVYEFLDASGPEWSRHLDGAKSLFDIAKDRMVPLTLPRSPVSIAQQVTERVPNLLADLERERPQRGLSQGRRAVFWNFARQDMLAAFINNTSTRLDTADLPMWRSAGLKLTHEGFLCPSNPQHPEYVVENAMPDDLISNGLVWLLQKLVNFIAAGDDVPEAVSTLGLGVRQQELLEYWEGMDKQLRIWYEGLPDSFNATAVRAGTGPDGTPGVEEQWFPRPMCASTIQSYHFARIQLLHNKPHMSTGAPFSSGLARPQSSAGSSLAARHASYASILQQSRTHAKEIVAIGLGRTDEGARIHSVQPLWTAGLVLGVADEGEGVSAETQRWRRSIISQLRGIERDMGWASEYRVQSLLELWELPSDWGLQDESEVDDGRQYDALGI